MQAGLAVPTFDAGSGIFTDGSATICDAFLLLIDSYATPGDGSAVVDAALAAESAQDDIVGNVRGASPDVGAVEQQ